MNITFTGHRDRYTLESSLDAIHEDYPNATWILGGARGFDTQVEDYCKKHRIPFRVIRPHKEHISQYGYKKALLLRDDEMADLADGIVFACYDGRKPGGTHHTVEYAEGHGKRVVRLPCKPLLETTHRVEDNQKLLEGC